MKLIQTDYDEHYHEHPLLREKPDSQRNRKRLGLLREFCPGGRFLEIGCGRGGLLRMAAEYFEVEGVEISIAQAQSLQAEFGARVRQADIQVEALPRARYHAVAAFNLLEHLRDPGQVLKNVQAALQPGGVMIGSMPNNFGLVGGIATAVNNFFDRTHIATYSPAVWQALFEQAGFGRTLFFGEITLGRNRAIYVRGAGWKVVSFNLMFVAMA